MCVCVCVCIPDCMVDVRVGCVARRHRLPIQTIYVSKIYMYLVASPNLPDRALAQLGKLDPEQNLFGRQQLTK